VQQILTQRTRIDIWYVTCGFHIIFLTVPSQDLKFHQHMLWLFCIQWLWGERLKGSCLICQYYQVSLLNILVIHKISIKIHEASFLKKCSKVVCYASRVTLSCGKLHDTRYEERKFWKIQYTIVCVYIFSGLEKKLKYWSPDTKQSTLKLNYNYFKRS
jgi:hypothetical protein